MSVFGKSQRYLSVLQKVSDLEMRLDQMRAEVDRQILAARVSEVPSGADDEQIAEEIERRFRAVLADSLPTLVSEVRSKLEENWDLEATIGKEVFRLLENHLPELTAKELTEDEIVAVTEEICNRVRRDIEGLVESKLGQLIPLLEKENSSSLLDEIRPRMDQVTDGMRRAWEEVARLKMTTRKLGKQVEALQGKGKDRPGGAEQIPERLMGRASIEDLVKERVDAVIHKKGSDSERRIAQVEDRLTKLSRVLESSRKTLESKPASPSHARRGKRKALSSEEKEQQFDQILNTTLRIRDR